MHYLVKLIVSGENEEEAISNAGVTAEMLVEQGDFDWFDMNGRWGAPQAFKLDSEDGKASVNEAITFNRDDFEDAMAHVRYMVENFTDEQIFENQLGSREEQQKLREENKRLYSVSRYMLTKAGGDTMSYLYGEHGGAIGNLSELEYELNEAGNKWVVGVDFHN